MRGRTLVALCLALALALVPAATAVADGGAQAAAKPAGKGKGSSCKGKGKGKAKGKGCKGKGSKGAGGALANGTYSDKAGGVKLTVTGNGKNAVLVYMADKFCVPLEVTTDQFKLTDRGSKLSGNGTTVMKVGGYEIPFTFSLSIEKSNLAYLLDVDMRVNDPEMAGCQLKDKAGGALKKS